MVEFRSMEHTDIDAGLRLSQAANWNQLRRDWTFFLERSLDACAVAVSRGNVVGTVTTISYSGIFSWIGMLLVDQAYQRQGIGIGLLQEALRILRPVESVKLDATPAGREVYLKLGFVEECRFSRMVGQVKPGLHLESDVREICKDDWPAIVEFDRQAFGADRQSLLTWLFGGAYELAYICCAGETVQGFCLGRPGGKFIQIGPVVAIDLPTAKKLLAAALSNCSGKDVVIDTAHGEPSLPVWLESIGFKEQRPFIRMYKGRNSIAGSGKNQFAIAGPEFG